MSFLKGIFGGIFGAGAYSLAKDYIEKHGGIAGVVAELEKTGFGQQAKSWVSTGPNLPITAEQIKQALGSDKVKELAAATGIPVDKAADLLAKYLPGAVDKATPGGKLPV
ncbi:MAG: YidB family protein [Beijerinckiaceae bacterium]|nr:YidB family protein [Beijerinckiaceae bacterium]